MLINDLKNKLQFDKLALQTISVKGKLCDNEVSVLRLDCLDSQISGNKWFKLQFFLDAFFKSGKSILATFGGAYSNHIAATASACQLLSIPCIGFIRGEEPASYSPTLTLAKVNGMAFHFLSREAYKNKEQIIEMYPDCFWVPEGGYGELGMLGTADIWNYVPNKEGYTHVFLPVGSGTTIAGLLHGANALQKIIGVSVMKGNLTLEREIATLVQEDEDVLERLTLLYDYHLGGYAKKTDGLLTFMNQIWNEAHVPLDFVYTAKAFYAMMDCLDNGKIPQQAKILFIHTGGLQGNLSLPAGTLVY